MDDILIRGGQVIDGTGAPARVADVAIRASRIVAIEADRPGGEHGSRHRRPRLSGGPGLHQGRSGSWLRCAATAAHEKQS